MQYLATSYFWDGSYDKLIKMHSIDYKLLSVNYYDEPIGMIDSWSQNCCRIADVVNLSETLMYDY